MHKGFKCLDIPTGRVYVCRDVIFDENIFPFKNLHPNAGAKLRSEVLLLPPALLNRESLRQGGEVTDVPMTNDSTNDSNPLS
jgi:hypothetical protein